LLIHLFHHLQAEAAGVVSGTGYRLIILIAAIALAVVLLWFIVLITVAQGVALFAGTERGPRGLQVLRLLLRSFLEILRMLLRGRS
jgi:hypothetical protein